jgi:hypothetical protein
MGVDIHGWVEVRLDPAEDQARQPLANWVAVLLVGSLLDRNADMFASLFGLSNVSRFRPLAPDRGFPSDPSLVLAENIEQLGPWLARGEVGHPSWLTWAEINEIDWTETAQTNEPVGLSSVAHVAARRDALSEPWELLFDLMRRLSQDYGGDNVRLVVWFSA